MIRRHRQCNCLLSILVSFKQSNHTDLITHKNVNVMNQWELKTKTSHSCQARENTQAVGSVAKARKGGPCRF